MMAPNSSTKLDMYLSTSTRPFFNALGDWMKEELGRIDNRTTRQSGFCFGQICGIDFAKADPGTYSYLATLSLKDKAVPPGYYHSVLITPLHGGLEKLEDFNPSEHPVAINEWGSFSGSVVFSSHMLGRGDKRFPKFIKSGGHLNSIKMVSAGKVMLAAIDRLSLNMACVELPQEIEHIRILGTTRDYPGLPFVVPGKLATDDVDLLTQHLLDFAETEVFAKFAPYLGVDGIKRLSSADYAGMGRL